MSLFQFQLLFLGLVACLLLAESLRWAKTSQTHPDHRARGDMVRLLVIALLGLGGTLARSGFAPRSAGFWLLSAALIPVSVAALVFMKRLFLAYRGSGRSAETTPVAAETSHSASDERPGGP
jgi:tellurite resistance protein TehA-like permease